MTTLQEASQPVVTSTTSKGVVVPKVATLEALKVLHLSPVKTVWGWDGRTVLERLPAESQAYQLGYYDDQAYVYINPQRGRGLGAGSLQVGASNANSSELVIESGVITWKGGQSFPPRLAVDITALNQENGLQNGEYQVGYTLKLDYPTTVSPVPGYSLVKVEKAELSTAAVSIGVSDASIYHDDYFAVTDSSLISASWWPGDNTTAGDYYPGSWFVLDFRQPVEADGFHIEADPDYPPTAACSVYYSDDAIIWYKSNQVQPLNGEWNIDTKGSGKHRYWKLFFWDGSASIKSIRYTGEAYYPDLRTVGPVSIAEPFIDDQYEEIEGDFILLAFFTVIDGNIADVRDQRRFINRKYEPVASWLTTFQDESFSCLFNDVQNYAERYLSPPTADYHLYEEMDDSICSGLGQLTLGSEEAAPQIAFPESVEIVTGALPSLGTPPLTTQTDEFLLTEPDLLELQTEGILEEPSFGLSISGIDLVKVPEILADLATKGSTDTTFSQTWSVDDGIY
tara:strand:+ start:11638 stop:13167 length:1530 start_codon:yes stop_codon:yes gene_type:complete